MKPFFLSLLLLILNNQVTSAQIGVSNNPTLGRPNKVKPIPQDLYDHFKSTTTIFVYLNYDKDNLDLLNTELKKVWTITPFKLIPYSDLKNYLNSDKYSFFKIKPLQDNYDDAKGFAKTDPLIYLSLTVPVFNKRSKLKEESIARVELYAKSYAVLALINNVKKDNYDEVNNFIYNDDSQLFNNWSVGEFINYVRCVHNHLLSNKPISMYQDFDDRAKLKDLEKDTLFVPEYVYESFESADLRNSKNETLPEYPYPSKIISDKELSQKLLSSEKSVYYLMYLWINNQKYINVFDSKTGESIYSDYMTMKFKPFLKSSDYKDIAKYIKK